MGRHCNRTRKFTQTALLFLVLFIPPALAGSDLRINKDEANLAIEGYDTVAYFTESRAVMPCLGISAVVKRLLFKAWPNAS